VEHRQRSDLASDVLRIRPHLEQRLARRSHQLRIENALMPANDATKLLGDGEHDLEVGDRKDLLASRLHPVLTKTRATFRARTVPA